MPYYKNGKQMLRVGCFSGNPVKEVTFSFKEKSQKLPVKLYKCDIPSFKPVLKEKQTSQTAYIRLESFLPNGTKASEINFDRWCKAGLNYLNKSNVWMSG